MKRKAFTKVPIFMLTTNLNDSSLSSFFMLLKFYSVAKTFLCFYYPLLFLILFFSLFRFFLFQYLCHASHATPYYYATIIMIQKAEKQSSESFALIGLQLKDFIFFPSSCCLSTTETVSIKSYLGNFDVNKVSLRWIFSHFLIQISCLFDGGKKKEDRQVN